MAFTIVPVWKEAPFIRLLVPLVAGILIQKYYEQPFLLYWSAAGFSILLNLVFSCFKTVSRFRYYPATGFLFNLLVLSCGALLTYYSEANKRTGRSVEQLEHNDGMIVRLLEPLSEKSNSFKADAELSYVLKGDSLTKTSEHILLYFEKDSSIKQVHFNSRIAFTKPLQKVHNLGNPGAFNYQEYCAFQGIYYQVYLRRNDYAMVSGGKERWFRHFLFASRQYIVDILQMFIRGKIESGMAEALLIGYKDHLDKGLVQTYSNTGVVHIIAISGLHVGLIYWLLGILFKPVASRCRMPWLKAMPVVAGLWLFGLLAGGSASVLRSVLMFTFIVVGENINRKTFVYNSLAASAFLLLCYNPFWLWDAGFQLSYIAVLSIVIYMKPAYNSLLITNKSLDLLWQMAAVSLAAQVLTTPISIFSFHQFPVYFLITNLVAVPLSSLIVFAELLLCAISSLPLLAGPVGWMVSWLIRMMNKFVGHMNMMPFSSWTQLQLSISEVIFTYGVIAAATYWIFSKDRYGLVAALVLTGCMSVIRSIDVARANRQHRLIVYNIPRRQAIDFIDGNEFLFVGDQHLQSNPLLNNMYLKPSRILYRANKPLRADSAQTPGCFYFFNTRIIIIDKVLEGESYSQRCKAEIVIFTGNPDMGVKQVLACIVCKQFVFDSSNPAWKIKRWQNECKLYGVPCYSVPENGPFILNMN